jgi:hypothetical protein
MKASNPSSNRRRNLLYLAGSLALIALVFGYYVIPVISESLALKYYESKVDPILQRGMAIKNYLRTLETSLRASSGNTLAEMTPERLKALPACAEELSPYSDLPNVEILKWRAPTNDAKSDPWKNLAAHWASGSHVERSAVKMLHLNMAEDGTCEPDVRILVEGTDSNGKHRQDTFYARLRVNFAGPLPVVSDMSSFHGQSLLLTGVPTFTDEAKSYGLNYQPPETVLRDDLKYAVYNTMGGGVAVGDFNRDGWEDVYLVGSQPNTSRLFKNVKGSFEDITEKAGVANLERWAIGAAVGDVDRDGDLDIVVTHGFSPPTLFRNQGDATFVAKPFSQVPNLKDEGAATPTFADVDRDGDVDLFVAYYGPISTQVPDTIFMGLNGLQDRLYINDGTGHFTEEAQRRGLEESRWTFQSTFADFDEDGDDDLYQVNDFGRNTLYVNDGTGHFTDRTIGSGTEAFGFGMSGCWGDYDADGKLDLYISGIASGVQWFAEEPDVLRFYLLNAKRSQYLAPAQIELISRDLEPYLGPGQSFFETLPEARRRYFQGNILLHREGDGFVDVSKETGTYYAEWSWGSGFVDFQNDGLPDVFATNGFITGKKADDL